MTPAAPPLGPPLDLPWYRAPFRASIGRFFRKYAVFSGRASRAEFWWWTLLDVAVGLLLQVADGVATGNWLGRRTTPLSSVGLLWGLATFVPALAVTWRRLHDADRSGGWFFLLLIPFVGVVVLTIFLVSPPQAAGRRWDRPAAAEQAGVGA